MRDEESNPERRKPDIRRNETHPTAGQAFSVREAGGNYRIRKSRFARLNFSSDIPLVTFLARRNCATSGGAFFSPKHAILIC